MDIAKAESANLLQDAVQFAISRSNSIFRILPFKTIDEWDWTEQFTLEEARSHYRAINEEPGVTDYDSKSLHFAMSIMATREGIDRILKRRPEGAKALAKALQEMAAGMGFQFAEDFIKGSSEGDPREFDGLQRIFETQMDTLQTMDTGNVAGAALSLEVLNEAFDRVNGGTDVILMNPFMKRKFQKAMETNGVGGDFRIEKDRFGIPVELYNGTPIVTLRGTRNLDNVLPFDEVSPIAGGNATDSTSIYLLNLGEKGFYGAQQFAPTVISNGPNSGSVIEEVDVEWTAAAGVGHDQVGVRIGGVNALDIVV
jgi:hypothetical protein